MMVRPRQNRARRLVTRLHLWLGLGLGGLLVLAGLTGSLLVFYVEIDARLHPEQAAAGSANLASYDRAIATLHRAYPGKTGPWRIEVTHRAGAIPAPMGRATGNGCASTMSAPSTAATTSSRA